MQLRTKEMICQQTMRLKYITPLGIQTSNTNDKKITNDIKQGERMAVCWHDRRIYGLLSPRRRPLVPP